MSDKVLIFGTFDHFHPGHAFLLDYARTKGELWVVVARDANVARIKGCAPDHHQSARMKAVRDYLPEAHVVLGSDGNDFLAPVRDIQPDLILLGYDQRMPPNVKESDLPCPVERIPAHEPHRFKSSIVRELKTKNKK